MLGDGCGMSLIPFCETAFHPEYKRLGAIVGNGKLKAEHWDSWARLVDKYSWPVLLRAADRVDPLSRWPAAIESICQSLKLESEQEEKEAESRARIDARPKPTDRQGSAKLFAETMARHGLGKPQ